MTNSRRTIAFFLDIIRYYAKFKAETSKQTRREKVNVCEKEIFRKDTDAQN